jgi:hypothetical protein
VLPGKEDFYLHLKLSALNSLIKKQVLDEPSRSAILNEVTLALFDQKSLLRSHSTDLEFIFLIKSILKKTEPDIVFFENALDYLTENFLQLGDLGKYQDNLFIIKFLILF